MNDTAGWGVKPDVHQACLVRETAEDSPDPATVGRQGGRVQRTAVQTHPIVYCGQGNRVGKMQTRRVYHRERKTRIPSSLSSKNDGAQF